MRISNAAQFAARALLDEVVSVLHNPDKTQNKTAFFEGVIQAAIDAETKPLIVAVQALRAAQRAYMQNRGNETYGRAVGVAAEAVDAALAPYEDQ